MEISHWESFLRNGVDPYTENDPILRSETEFSWRCKRKGNTVIAAEKCKWMQTDDGKEACLGCPYTEKGKIFIHQKEKEGRQVHAFHKVNERIKKEEENETIRRARRSL